MRFALRLRPSGFLFAVAAFLVFAALAPQRPDERGKLIFDTVCSGCHSMTPPALDAPPMLMVAEHYVQAKETEEAAMAAMKEWIPNPAVEKSLLPAHAIEKFGLMDPLALPADDLDAVVAYIFAERAKAGSMPGMKHGQSASPDTTHGCQGGGQCRMHQQQGQGMQHGQMQHSDGAAATHQCPMHQSSADSTKTKGAGQQHRHGQNR